MACMHSCWLLEKSYKTKFQFYKTQHHVNGSSVTTPPHSALDQNISSRNWSLSVSPNPGRLSRAFENCIVCRRESATWSISCKFRAPEGLAPEREGFSGGCIFIRDTREGITSIYVFFRARFPRTSLFRAGWCVCPLLFIIYYVVVRNPGLNGTRIFI